MSTPDEEHLYTEELANAVAAVEHANRVRLLHRRRTERGSKQRQDDIRLALDGLKRAMYPLRRRIGRFPYEPINDKTLRRQQTIRQVSEAIQRERRKLSKMKAKPRRKPQT